MKPADRYQLLLKWIEQARRGNESVQDRCFRFIHRSINLLLLRHLRIHKLPTNQGMPQMKIIQQLIEAIKQMFRVPSADVIAMHELEEAKRQLLQMQTAKDYSSRMVEYNMDRIRRLNTHMLKTTQEDQK